MNDRKYWITPPDVLKQLYAEFAFDFDPCPYPKTFDGLTRDWGEMNYVNPPFCARDGSPTAFARKAVEQLGKGRSSVLILPVPLYVNILLGAGAEVRPFGRVKWLSAIDGAPMPAPGPVALFVLRKPFKP